MELKRARQPINLDDNLGAKLKRAVRDVEILQNINITHQRNIAEKDKLIEQLDSQLKHAIQDVDILGRKR